MTTSELEPATWVPELTFAARLALVRHRQGWNIKEAALACGVPPQSWRGWEVQHRLPHDMVDTVKRIALRTGVDREWLLFGPEIAGVEATGRYPQPPSRWTSVDPLGARVVGVVGEPRSTRPAATRIARKPVALGRAAA
jgi:hypothetical protein